jgi:hypothetical protein
MKTNSIFVRMSVMVLALGLSVIGCSASGAGGGSGGDDINVGNEDGDKLPVSTGVNALSGQTYFDNDNKIEFSPTAEGEDYGTYKNSRIEKYHGQPVLSAEKYQYLDDSDGKYYWNETDKTVTLAPEQVAYLDSDGNGDPLNKAAFKVILKNWYDAFMESGKVGCTEKEYLESEGLLAGKVFLDADEYLDYWVAEQFKEITNHYDFSPDGAALFLDEKLPANIDSNELSGQTYYGTSRDEIDSDIWVIDQTKTYTFTADGYTYDWPNLAVDQRPETGTYSYNSTTKRVWFKQSTSARAAAWEAQVSGNTDDTGYFTSVDDYNAAMVNSAGLFRKTLFCSFYDPAENIMVNYDSGR